MLGFWPGANETLRKGIRDRCQIRKQACALLSVMRPLQLTFWNFPCFIHFQYGSGFVPMA
jgi:hypothetical protein